MKTITIFLVWVCAVLLFANGCSKSVLQKAFRGDFPTAKSNRVITEYCQSCHNHRELNPDEHVIALSKHYKNRIYSRAKECRVCHDIRADIWEYEKHETRYPEDVKKGIFKEFEESLSIENRKL